MKKTLFTIIAAIIIIGSLQAQKTTNNNKSGNWQKLGETTVDFKTEKAVVTISVTDNFKALRILATDAPVHIANLIVLYENSDPENIPIRYDFKTGVESRAIDLEGKNLKIKEVDFIYRTVPNQNTNTAHVEIWGLK